MSDTTHPSSETPPHSEDTKGGDGVEDTSMEDGQALRPFVWSAGREVALFQSLGNGRPIGIHKHFQILGVYRRLLLHPIISAPSARPMEPLTMAMIWDHLATFYDLKNLDLLDEEEQEENIGPRDQYHEDFYLPVAEYASIVHEECGPNSGEVLGLLSEYSREESVAPSEDRYASAEPEEMGENRRRSRQLRDSTEQGGSGSSGGRRASSGGGRGNASSGSRTRN